LVIFDTDDADQLLKFREEISK
jgi:regulator of protease activity HflC (stomatin/prohibitin superfamily)